MQRGKWVPMDKRLVSSLPTGKREFTELEAAFCVTCDYDNGNVASVSGYAKQWTWSRKRVSSFAKKMGWSLTTSRSKKVSLIDIDRGVENISIRDSTWKGGASRVASQAQVGGKSGASQAQVGGKLNDGITEGYEPKGTSPAQVGNKSGTSRGQVGGKLGSTTIDPNPNPDPNPDKTNNSERDFENESNGTPDSSTGNNPEVGTGGSGTKGCSPSSGKEKPTMPGFEKVWSSYPNKRGKKESLAYWKRNKLEPRADEIYSKLERQKLSRDWQKDGGRYIPAGSTWFRGDRWDDELGRELNINKSNCGAIYDR